ncbi:2-phosphosulfolactate phosphatase [Cecembia rubra]|uniref:Probable 2-phosphosulfolactate phosphatase n=1 Tax=Cecembia rubra TaxID=1485585 RepID=A0A2P8EAV5_9BACT|nr:2-phosphosulfolactate phosphatase [Cecembia rubra]PSL06602.1 2-phosphosulfolactate phosphatase [Cecembia rubra]
MKKIETCLSPQLLHLYEIKGKNVLIVDIFRATTSMIAALANNVISITPFKNLEECEAMKPHGYVIAGEREGKKVANFDLGNSPLSYLNNAFSNKKIAITTTNGTLAIEMVKENANNIIIGAFINLNATIKYLKSQKEDLLILCAGWKGKFNLEDSLYAGAVAYLLKNAYTTECDGTLALKSLYEANKNNMAGFLANASHTKRLQNQNIEADIDFCLTFDIYELIGLFKNGVIQGQIL